MNRWTDGGTDDQRRVIGRCQTNVTHPIILENNKIVCILRLLYLKEVLQLHYQGNYFCLHAMVGVLKRHFLFLASRTSCSPNALTRAPPPNKSFEDPLGLL